MTALRVWTLVAACLLVAAGCRLDPVSESSSENPPGSVVSRDGSAEPPLTPVTPVEGPKTRPEGQPEDKSSGGTLSLSGLRASRTNCVSPCSVMFSIDAIEDTADPNPFAHSGVYWDYGDPDADTRDGLIERGATHKQAKRGVSRQSDTNTPLGMHTYQCETGICRFHPGVTVQNAAGDWVTAWSTVQVRAQATAYPKTRTVCVSAQGRWDGDAPCPADASRARSLPTMGSWRSDTRYLLRRGERFDVRRSCIAYGRRGITVTAFGNATDPKPELGMFGVGRSRSCTDATTTDRDIATYQVPHWIEDVTLADLRVAAVGLGMAFKNVSLHDLDMDFERQAEGGVIFSAATRRCRRDDRLSCSRVPLPYGLYVSGSTVIGSRTNPPGVNIAMVDDACVSFFGILDSEVRLAAEHNVRVECSSRLLVAHSDINAGHIGGKGPKCAVTIRPEGSLVQDMLLGRRKDAKTRAGMFESRYTVLKDLYLSNPRREGENAARLQIAPTQTRDAEVTRFGVVSGNYVDMQGTGPFADARLAGTGLVCYDDNRWESKTGCTDGPRGTIPEGGFEPSELDFAAPKVPKPPSSY